MSMVSACGRAVGDVLVTADAGGVLTTPHEEQIPTEERTVFWGAIMSHLSCAAIVLKHVDSTSWAL